MIKFRLPFYFDKNINDSTIVRCFHCGKDFALAIKNIRAVNYCNGCK